jgi:hypothetical protein
LLIKKQNLNQAENNAINSLKQPGAKLGGNSTFGTVKALGDKYALKTMKFDAIENASDNLKIFLNEIRVGGTPGIEKVGPRIYAWRILRDYSGTAVRGEYIMDSFTRGNKSVESMSLRDYVRKTIKTCPAPNHPLFIMLKKTLKDFYVITQGYHGDLHAGNIAVVYDPTNFALKRVIIFDYGSHKKFKSRVNSTMCLERIFNTINTEFTNSSKKYSGNKIGTWPSGSSVTVLYRNRGQPIRSNTQIMKSMIPSGKIYNAHETQKFNTLYKYLTGVNKLINKNKLNLFYKTLSGMKNSTRKSA